jgi:indolepyruvate ferredoxin oxidoreductase
MMKAFGLLARFKSLRGTPLDLFGYTAERRHERELLAAYERDLELIRSLVAPGRIVEATALASLPQTIRGFGHVKAANAAKAQAEHGRLVERLKTAPAAPRLEAAE